MHKKTSAIIIAMFLFLILLSARTAGKSGEPKLPLHALNEIPAAPTPIAAWLPPKFDVIVYGGDPEGVAAAVAAARNGARTLLLAPQARLGGLFTLGALNFLDTSLDIHGHITSGGIFREWLQQVGGGPTFEIQDAERAFERLVKQEPRITLRLNARITQVRMQGRALQTIAVQGEQGKSVYRADRYIDATPDADLAALSGAPYSVGEADIGRPNHWMAATLIMHYAHVRWGGIREAAQSRQFGQGVVRGHAAYGFDKIPRLYRPQERNTKVRGMNLALMQDGSVYINGLQLFGVNGLDSRSKQKAMRIGQRETVHFLKFLRSKFPGFEQAEVADYPQMLYIRETRHIRARYQLPILDVWDNRDHWDSIGLASYAVDMQATTTDEQGYVVAQPKQYAIPFRTLVPLQVDNLLVVGRSAGFTSLAAGSARVVPTGMVCGEAAGTAAALSIKVQESFPQFSGHSLHVKLLQRQLQKQGANLYPFQLKSPYADAWFSPALHALLPLGVIATDYANHIDITQPMSRKAFDECLAKVVMRADRRLYERLSARLDLWSEAGMAANTQPITRDQAIRVEARFAGLAPNLSWREAIRAGLVDPVLRRRLSDNRVLNKAEVYALAADCLRYLQELI